VQAFGNQGQIGIQVARLLRNQEAGDGGIIVDQQAAIAIIDLSARRQDGNFADAVGFRQGTIILRA
jgi:hypothetical protein